MLIRTVVFILLATLISHQAFCASQPYEIAGDDDPWFTGPLLTSSARVVRKGHINIEPYIFWINNTGRYQKDWTVAPVIKKHRWNPQLTYKIGLTETLDFSGTFQAVYNTSQGKTAGGFGDTPIALDYQLFMDDNDAYLPIFKITLQESLPTGNYQKLSSHKLGLDGVGSGSFVTQLSFTAAKLTRYGKHNFLNLRLNIALNVPAPISVKGLNTDGGDPTTRGRVYLGNWINLMWGAEYSLTRNWALALDLTARVGARTRFKGHTQQPMGAPSDALFTAAPALEYNWNASVGFIAGAWFSFAGRNTRRFSGASAALNYFY
jgi:hypothetical protein